MYLLSNNYSLQKVLYLLIKFKKTKSFLENTKSVNRIGVIEQSTQTEIWHEEGFVRLKKCKTSAKGRYEMFYWQ